MQINVFLRITKKREDGYHDLASLFHVSNGILLFDDIRCNNYSKLKLGEFEKLFQSLAYK